MNEKKLTKESQIHITSAVTNSTIGNWCEIGQYNIIENSYIGDYSYTCSNCIIQNAVVKNFSNIAAHVRIGATDHPIERPSLHHFTYRSSQYGFSNSDDETIFEERENRVAKIGHDTWIGHGSLIKPGITIGNGAVIGSMSVVTKNVPEYSIVVGNPAKLLRLRFDDKIVEALEQIKWWNWSHDTIKERLEDFRGSIEVFVEKYL